MKTGGNLIESSKEELWLHKWLKAAYKQKQSHYYSMFHIADNDEETSVSTMSCFFETPSSFLPTFLLGVCLVPLCYHFSRSMSFHTCSLLLVRGSPCKILWLFLFFPRRKNHAFSSFGWPLKGVVERLERPTTTTYM